MDERGREELRGLGEWITEQGEAGQDLIESVLDALAACSARLVRYKAVAEAARRVAVTEYMPSATPEQNIELRERAGALNLALAALDERGEEAG